MLILLILIVWFYQKMLNQFLKLISQQWLDWTRTEVLASWVWKQEQMLSRLRMWLYGEIILLLNIQMLDIVRLMEKTVDLWFRMITICRESLLVRFRKGEPKLLGLKKQAVFLVLLMLSKIILGIGFWVIKIRLIQCLLSLRGITVMEFSKEYVSHCLLFVMEIGIITLFRVYLLIITSFLLKKLNLLRMNLYKKRKKLFLDSFCF